MISTVHITIPTVTALLRYLLIPTRSPHFRLHSHVPYPVSVSSPGRQFFSYCLIVVRISDIPELRHRHFIFKLGGVGHCFAWQGTRPTGGLVVLVCQHIIYWNKFYNFCFLGGAFKV